MHRSYIDHSSIQIAIYDDRLEITSPGRLPMGQTIARMKEGYSKIRNEALAAAFSYMRLIEHWGSGIPRIIEEVRKAGLGEPEFLGGDTDLRINIYRHVDAPASDTASGVRDTDGLTDDERAVIHYAQVHGEITSAVAKNVLNLQERQTQKILAGLVNRGLLQRIGAARSTRYVLADTTEANENHD